VDSETHSFMYYASWHDIANGRCTRRHGLSQIRCAVALNSGGTRVWGGRIEDYYSLASFFPVIDLYPDDGGPHRDTFAAECVNHRTRSDEMLLMYIVFYATSILQNAGHLCIWLNFNLRKSRTWAFPCLGIECFEPRLSLSTQALLQTFCAAICFG
jgi:hypothetical protein